MSITVGNEYVEIAEAEDGSTLLLLNPILPVPIQMELLKKASTNGFRLRDIQTISTTIDTTMPVIGTL